MDKKYNGFNNGRDRSDGVGGREVNHGKQETMTKEQILWNLIIKDPNYIYDFKDYDEFLNEVKNIHGQRILAAMSDWEQQQLSAERERAGKLVDTLKYAQTKFYENSIVYNSIKQTLNEYDTATK